MTATRLVAIDLDGTLIGEDLTISAADRAAIAKAQAAGVEVCLATGRLFSASAPFANDLGLRGFLIPLNGAAVFDVPSRLMLHAVPLDKSVAVTALDQLREKGFRVQLYFGDRMFLDGMDERSEKYIRLSRIQPVKVPDLRALLTVDPPPEKEPLKLLGIASEAEVLAQVAQLGARLGSRANVFRSQPPYIEVTDPGADKGHALRWVAGQRNIDAASVAAIGDSDNDAPMFAFAGRSYAVAGATPLARASAHKVVGPRGAGVAEALNDILERVTCETR